MANTWRLLWPVQSRSEGNPGYFCIRGWKQQHKHSENYKVLGIKLHSRTFAAAGLTVSSCRFFFLHTYIYFFFYSVCWSNSPQLTLQLDSPVDFSSDGPAISPRLVIVPSVLTPADASRTPCCWGLHSEASFVRPDWFFSGAVPHFASQWIWIFFLYTTHKFPR